MSSLGVQLRGRPVRWTVPGGRVGQLACGRFRRVSFRDHAATQPGMGREHAVVAHAVHARWRDERGELAQEPLGRQRQPQRVVARPLHPVQQRPVVAAGEAVQRERRSQDVAAEPLAAIAIIGVDPHPGVEQEAGEEGAAPGLLERLGVAQI